VDKTQGADDLHRPTSTVTAGTSYNDVLPSLNLIGDLGNTAIQPAAHSGFSAHAVYCYPSEWPATCCPEN